MDSFYEKLERLKNSSKENLQNALYYIGYNLRRCNKLERIAFLTFLNENSYLFSSQDLYFGISYLKESYFDCMDEEERILYLQKL